MKIVDSKGDPVPLEKEYEMDKNGFQIDEETEEAKQVFKPQTAWWSILMMRDVFKESYGTGHSVNIEGLDIAGKTGTTQGSKEGWMVGYTSDTVLAVSVFNTVENGKKGNFTVGKNKEPHKIWKKIMVESGINSKDMKRPAGVQDPQPIFKLEDLNLTLQQEGTDVVATWNQQDPSRVQYTLERSTSNGGPFTPVTTTNGNSYKDSVPYQELSNGIGGIIPGLGKKEQKYYYRLTAVDKQATTNPDDPSDNGGMSETVTGSITVKLNSDDQGEDPPDCSKEENKELPQCQDDGNGNGNGGGDGDGDRKYTKKDCTKLFGQIDLEQFRQCEQDPKKFFEEHPEFKDQVWIPKQQSALPATRRNFIA